MHDGWGRVGVDTVFSRTGSGRANQLFLMLQIELPEQFWRDFPGRKIEGDLAIAQSDNALKTGKRNIDLMQRHHQRDAARARFCEERIHDLFGACRIERRQGFVD